MTNTNDHITIDRDERHPSISVSSIAGIDNVTLNNILNSIIQPNGAPQSHGTTQYLLPVDLVVSVDNKSNKPTVQAALPSSFALQMTPMTPLQPIMTPLSIPHMNIGSIPPLNMAPLPSTLNPSAPSFHPYTPCTNIPPILEQETDIDDAWCTYDQEQESENKTPFKARLRYDKRRYNKNWRNRNCNNAINAPWRNKIPKLMAEFVAHITLPNREEYLPNKIYTKTWAMRNTGNVEWGYNVELVWCKGDKTLSLYDRYPVINAQSAQKVEISATIKTPNIPKRYCTYFRLQKNGRFFGPRVWVDIIVGTLDHTKNCGAHEKVFHQKTSKWKKKHSVVVSCQ